MQKLRAFLHFEDVAKGGKEVRTFASSFLTRKRTTGVGEVFYEKQFNKPKLLGSVMRDKKYLYRVVSLVGNNGEQLLTRKKVK